MKDTIIIVEGPQGVGKSKITTYLREQMSATHLHRLSGIKDREETGLPKITLQYEKFLEYMEICSDINMVFDRTFFTNEIYARIGYQKYSFTESYQKLLSKLEPQNRIIVATNTIPPWKRRSFLFSKITCFFIKYVPTKAATNKTMVMITTIKSLLFI